MRCKWLHYYLITTIYIGYFNECSCPVFIAVIVYNIIIIITLFFFTGALLNSRVHTNCDGRPRLIMNIVKYCNIYSNICSNMFIVIFCTLGVYFKFWLERKHLMVQTIMFIYLFCKHYFALLIMSKYAFKLFQR